MLLVIIRGGEQEWVRLPPPQQEPVPSTRKPACQFPHFSKASMRNLLNRQPLRLHLHGASQYAGADVTGQRRVRCWRRTWPRLRTGGSRASVALTSVAPFRSAACSFATAGTVAKEPVPLWPRPGGWNHVASCHSSSARHEACWDGGSLRSGEKLAWQQS